MATLKIIYKMPGLREQEGCSEHTGGETMAVGLTQ